MTYVLVLSIILNLTLLVALVYARSQLKRCRVMAGEFHRRCQELNNVINNMRRIIKK